MTDQTKNYSHKTASNSSYEQRKQNLADNYEQRKQRLAESYNAHKSRVDLAHTPHQQPSSHGVHFTQTQKENAELLADIGKFERIVASELQVSCKAAPFVNYSLFHSGNYPLAEITLKHNGKISSQNLMLTVSLQPEGYAMPWEINIPELKPGEVWTHPVKMILNGNTFKNLNEKTSGQLDIKVADKDERLATTLAPIEIHAYNEWIAAVPETLASFVQPNCSSLASVFNSASQHLREQTGDSGFSGYQRGQASFVLSMLNAIHTSLTDDITLHYINPPSSFERTGQKVLLPKDVITTAKGTCLDLAVLQASLWERAGLHSGIILIPGHAMVYCWLEQISLEEPLTRIDANQASQLKSLLNDDRLVIVNSVEIAQPTTFDAAQQAALNYVERTWQQDNAVHFIDLNACREAGLTPLA